MKTVAIVGSHPRTRATAPFGDKNKEIWVFNSAPTSDWCSRCTAVFEMHGPEEYTSPIVENSQYWAFLQNQDAVPVYMQAQDERVKNCKVFPLEEINQKYTGNFKRGGDPIYYYTSSVCYAIALALHQGFERIELYGVEMETNTEYLYQRDGVGLWLGIALGHGVEVYLPDHSFIFDAPRYGYDDRNDVRVTREDFEERAKQIYAKIIEAEKKVNLKRGEINNVTNQIEKNRTNGKSAKWLAETYGQLYANVTNEYEQAIGDYGYLQGLLNDCNYWQTKVEKMMIARGSGMEVFAMNESKLR
jgi:hypothetical protein